MKPNVRPSVHVESGWDVTIEEADVTVVRQPWENRPHAAGTQPDHWVDPATLAKISDWPWGKYVCELQRLEKLAADAVENSGVPPSRIDYFEDEITKKVKRASNQTCVVCGEEFSAQRFADVCPACEKGG